MLGYLTPKEPFIFPRETPECLSCQSTSNSFYIKAFVIKIVLTRKGFFSKLLAFLSPEKNKYGVRAYVNINNQETLTQPDGS